MLSLFCSLRAASIYLDTAFSFWILSEMSITGIGDGIGHDFKWILTTFTGFLLLDQNTFS